MDKRQQIKNIRLFTDVSDEALQQLELAVIPLRCHDGQIIHLDDETQDAVYLVVQGVVRVYRSNLSGREQNLIHLKAGDAFNLPSAFNDQGAIPNSAECLGEALLLMIPSGDFRTIVSRNPEIALAVLKDLSNKLIHLTRLTQELSLRTVRTRLARFLLDRSASDTSSVHWSHHEIAAQIGSVREVVSRIMRSFVRDGLIRIERQRIILLDADALEKEAGEA